MDGKMEGKKRPRLCLLDDDDDDDEGYHEKVYRFQVLLPNGISVDFVKRNPLGDMPLVRFLEKVKEKCVDALRRTEESSKHRRRKVLWGSKNLYLEDALGNKITNRLCFGDFKPCKLHYLKLFDGNDEMENTFENMWDLTPDTDLLTELPDDYTFETALADLIDNSLQAVWANGRNERKLISVEVNDEKVSVFDTGPGMDDSEENSLVKWGKMGASVHRSVKKHAIGGRPPYLKPFFGMFGYGGTIASMYLGRHAIVSAKTKESKKVYWLHLERDALLKKSGSGSDINWKAAGGIRDPSREEIEESPHGSFTKVVMKPKLKLPDISHLQRKLKDIYFPYIQCDEISKSGRTTCLVEFQVNGIDLAEIVGGEVATTNLHSCNGPDFVFNLHLSVDEDSASTKSTGGKACREANARLKCVYFPIVKGKENIERILENLKTEGCVIKEDFETFSRVSIRRLGRLLPDVRWGPQELMPFMKMKQRRGDKLQILRRCYLRVKCFIDTDAGFNPIPSKTDLAPQHPFTKALKDLGVDPHQKEKEVKVEVYRGEKKLTLLQLEKEYHDWILQMHSEYDEELSRGDDEAVLLVDMSNKEALGVSSEVVRVHQAISRKGKSWSSGQKVKILKGAYPGSNKNLFATLEYFLVEGFEGEAGGEARIICRPLGVPDQDGCVLTDNTSSPSLELRSSISLPIVVIDSGKCIAVGLDDWNCQLEKISLKMPSTIEVLDLKHCKELDIDGALPTKVPVSAGSVPPEEVVAVLRPSNFISSGGRSDLDQKNIIKDNYEMCMNIKFKAEEAKSCKLDHIFSGSATSTSRKGCHGLYVFSLGSVSSLFQKAGVYTFSFSLRKADCKGCEISLPVKASSKIKRWEVLNDKHLPLHVSAGSYFPPISIARYDEYDNRVPFNSPPEIVARLTSDDAMLCQVKVNVNLSPDSSHMVVKNIRITTDNLDKIRPSYEATLCLLQPDKPAIVSIPCQVVPGSLRSVTFYSLDPVKCLLPKQVLQDVKLEMFDRHGNHVKEGTKVELQVHGFCFLDQIGAMRQADSNGCIDLSGLLKVTGTYGEAVSLSALSDKEIIFTKRFRVEKRELRLVTKVPELCRAGSKLKDIAFEVVNPEGELDQTVHDEAKHGQHTLTIKTNFPNFDNTVRYAFRHGRCIIGSISLPRREGSFDIEAIHSRHRELYFKFKVNVSEAAHREDDNNYDSEASEEYHNDDNCQSIYEEITHSPLSFTSKNVGTVPQPRSKEFDVRSPVQAQAPRVKREESTFQSSGGKSQNAALFGGSLFQETQDVLNMTPLKQYGPMDKIDDGLLGPDFKDIQDAVKEIKNYGLQIKQYEQDLNYLEPHRDAICEELLKLEVTLPAQLSPTFLRRQHNAFEKHLRLKRKAHIVLSDVVLSESFSASLKLLPPDQSQKDAVLNKIESKVGSAAAVYCEISKDAKSMEQHLKSMTNVIGIVALLGTAPSLELSRLLAKYLGEDQMLALVCQSSAAFTPPESYEHELNSLAAKLGVHIRGSHMLIFLEDIRVYEGGLTLNDPRKTLALPKPTLANGTTPPGFLGYAVNLLDIQTDHLETLTVAGHGLRETLFYQLFGELQVYDNKENLKLARGCIKDGAVSLDGGIIRGIVSMGRAEPDVIFPVVRLENQLAVAEERRELTSQISKKSMQLSVAEEAITYTYKMKEMCLENFQGRRAECLKLIEEKEASSQKVRFSQKSLKVSPMPSQTCGQ